MKKLMAALAMVAMMVGCASTPQEKAADALSELITTKNKLIRDGQLAGIGVGISSDETVAYDKADVNARADLAKLIDAEVQSFTKSFKEQITVDGMESVAEHFQSTVKTTVDVQLNGATMTNVKVETVEGKFKVYGIVTLNTTLIEEYIKSVEDTENKLTEEQKQTVRELAVKAYSELNFEYSEETSDVH